MNSHLFPVTMHHLMAASSSSPATPSLQAALRHRIDNAISEMKRLYVRPPFRGQGLGRELTGKVIAEARQIGYKYIRLDTVEPVMKAAVKMYRQLGFSEIPPYRPNPIAGALYMELQL